MAKLYNLARVTTSTTGTGTITLGSAVSGFLSFAGAGVQDGDTVTYAISDGANSEIGRGVYTSSGTTLTRSVLKSTNSDAAINLSGTAEVFITAAAQDFIGANPNLLINGDFQINQRVFAGGALAAGVYGHDRWKAATGGANYSVSGYVVTLNSGALEQVVETALWGYASLASQVVTISIEAPSKDLAVSFGSQSGTITAGSGRRALKLALGAGDTGNLTLQIDRSADDGVTFGRVKLEIGATATDWQARTWQAEIALCCRYYCKGFPYSVAPGNDNALNSDGRIYSAFFFASTAAAGQRLDFPVTMRATPTVVFYSPNYAVYGTPSTPGFWSYFNGSAWVAGTATVTGGLDADGFYPGVNGSGMALGYGTFIKGGFTAESEL